MTGGLAPRSIADWIVRRLRRWRAAPQPGVTTEHVVWGYRLFLDREPENHVVVARKVATHSSTRSLRFDFINSYEFRQGNPEWGFVSERTIVIKELDDGLRLFIDLADAVVSLSIARGTYEPEEIAFVRQHVRPGQNVLDIGANLGRFTTLFAHLVGPTGHVHAFEPLPENTELIERSAAENRFGERITLHRAAVGAVAGQARFVFAPFSMNSGGGYLDQPDAEPPPGSRLLEVPVLRLDDVALRRPIDFVKIDVEGAELLALRGAAGLLCADRPMILSEINTRQLRIVSGCTPTAFIAEIEALGYECWLLSDGNLVRDSGNLDRDGVRTVVFAPTPV